MPQDSAIRNGEVQDKEEGDSGIDANSQGSCSSNDVKSKEKRKEKKKKKATSGSSKSSNRDSQSVDIGNPSSSKLSDFKDMLSDKRPQEKSCENKNSRTTNQNPRKGLVFEASRHPAEREDFEATGNETYIPHKSKKSHKYAIN